MSRTGSPPCKASPPPSPPRPSTPGELKRLAETVAASKAPSTRRAYRAAWNAWCAWSAARGTPALPAGPLSLAAFLRERADDGRSIASIRQTLSALGMAHKAAGHPAPAAHPGIAAFVAGLARQAAAAGRTARQARPLDAEAVAAIRAALHAREDRGRRPVLYWRALRDMALVSVLADAGLRRGEAAVLTWDDIATAGAS